MNVSKWWNTQYGVSVRKPSDMWYNCRFNFTILCIAILYLIDPSFTIGSDAKWTESIHIFHNVHQNILTTAWFEYWPGHVRRLPVTWG